MTFSQPFENHFPGVDMPVLRRYVDIAGLMDVLLHGSLPLLPYGGWDDKNDAAWVDEYANAMMVPGVGVSCMTSAPETFHHWKIFGSQGACIQFQIERFEPWVREFAQSHGGVRFGSVRYLTLPKAREQLFDPTWLAFVKRASYEDEQEFRIVGGNAGDGVERIPFAIEAIQRVTLSPFMHPSLVESVRRVLQGIDGCSTLQVSGSTLIQNNEWIGLASKRLAPNSTWHQSN